MDSTARLHEIEARKGAAAREAGRDVSDVTLVAISKTFAPEDIRPVLAAGHRVFGENRVQEAKAKWPSLREAFPGVELHLVGPLQTNKVREALQLFDVIHSLDRESLALALAKELERSGLSRRFFIQVNTGEEPQKAGVPPREAPAFVERCVRELRLPVIGLMCIPPLEEEPSLHFALLGKLAREAGLPALSMGMSHDFETAIAFGATHVRVGSAIFGAREAH